MFTGLVEGVGRVLRVSGLRGNRVLDISAEFASELKAGDSVAVNGCCLTVTRADKKGFQVEAVGATLAGTNLGELKPGSSVNLERALAVGDRLGGHFVQGHIDEVAAVAKVERESGFWKLGFRVKQENARLLVEHGSVCVNGVSLTIAGFGPGGFHVNVIPHTLENTNLKELRAGDRVNIEYDMLVKAIVRTKE